MENKLNWKLEDIFESEEKLENSIKALYDLLNKIKEYKGKLANSVLDIYECYKTLENALELHEKIYGYKFKRFRARETSPVGNESG